MEQYNENQSDEPEKDIKEDIYLLENEINLFDEMVDELWENVIMSEIRYGNLLKNISEYDKDIFYKYMLNNSEIINLAYKNLSNNNNNI